VFTPDNLENLQIRDCLSAASTCLLTISLAGRGISIQALFFLYFVVVKQITATYGKQEQAPQDHTSEHLHSFALLR
jgi:hypothetical protein